MFTCLLRPLKMPTGMVIVLSTVTKVNWFVFPTIHYCWLLCVIEHVIFTITPIQVLGPGFGGFAPLGLIDMINAGGAIESYEVQSMRKEIPDTVEEIGSLLSRSTLEDCSREAIACAKMEVKGCGRFGAYSSSNPRKCLVNDTEVEFSYDSATGLVTLQLQMSHSSPWQTATIEIAFIKP